MKIVDLKTFLALPSGTIFCKHDNTQSRDICIKGETSDKDDKCTYSKLVEMAPGCMASRRLGHNLPDDLKQEYMVFEVLELRTLGKIIDFSLRRAIKVSKKDTNQTLPIAKGASPFDDDPIEKLAKEIYSGWSDQRDYKPWVDGGNSLKQGEARRLAAQQIEKGKNDQTPEKESDIIRVIGIDPSTQGAGISVVELKAVGDTDKDLTTHKSVLSQIVPEKVPYQGLQMRDTHAPSFIDGILEAFADSLKKEAPKPVEKESIEFEFDVAGIGSYNAIELVSKAPNVKAFDIRHGHSWVASILLAEQNGIYSVVEYNYREGWTHQAKVYVLSRFLITLDRELQKQKENKKELISFELKSKPAECVFFVREAEDVFPDNPNKVFSIYRPSGLEPIAVGSFTPNAKGLYQLSKWNCRLALDPDEQKVFVIEFLTELSKHFNVDISGVEND